jgi:HK97 family phage major capsid protein
VDPYASPEELREERARLTRRIEGLHDRSGGAPLEGEQRDLWNQWNGEVDEIDKALGQMAVRQRRLEEIASSGGAVPGHPFGDDSLGFGERDRALRLVEGSHAREDGLSDRAAASLERVLLNRDPGGDLARQLTAVGSEAYGSWWDKVLRHGSSAGAHTTPEELAARERVALIERALGVSTGAGGGFLLPFDLDPTINLSSAGAINPIREIARVEQVTVNEWRGVTSAGGTASFDPEATEVSDDSPVLAQPVVQLDKAQYFVPFSIELDMDSASIRRELAKVATDAKATLEADKFLVGAGHGSNEPSGVLTGSPAPGTVSTTIAALSAGLTSAIEAVPNRFRPGASWLMGLNSINRIALLETANGARLFPSIDAERLLGRPVYEHSGIAGGTASGGTIAVVGDFEQYLVADRIGMTAEVVQHLFGNSNRPTGQRGFYAYWRTGGTALISNAFRQLRVT